MSEEELNATFGRLDYREGTGGRIILTPAWISQHIHDAAIPSLAAIGAATLQLNRTASPSFVRAFQAIADAGLSERILTSDGTWVPRHKGWDRNRGISSHSWGVTIDINARWNPYGAEPAQLGTVRSVRELVPYFAAEGFAWGGYFSPPYVDGMHFELARYNL